MGNEGTFRIAVRGLVMHQGKFLLVKRSKIARGEFGFWELPGGGLDFGESPEDALKRELQEEVQMDIELIKPLGVWHYLRSENVQIIGFTFLCKANQPEVILSHEHLEYAWIDKSEINNYKIFPELKEEFEEWSSKGLLD